MRSLGRRLAATTALAACGLALLAGAAAASTFDASTVTVSPDGQRVYAGQSGTSFSIFSRNPADGTLTPLGTSPPLPELGGGGCFCRMIAVSPDSAFVYSIDNGNNEVAYFARVAGGLELRGSYRNNVGGVTEMKYPQTITLSPDGTTAYVVGEEGTVSVFARDSVSGALTFLETQELNGNASWQSVVSPDGKFVYVGVRNGGIDYFSRDTATGRLSNRQTANAVVRAALAISPDGKFLFAGDEKEIVSFERDAITGALTEASKVVNGVGGVSGMSTTRSLAVSSDGLNLYATSFSDNSLHTFAIDGATGALSQVGAQFDGVGGVDGLAAAAEVSLSADGSSVYVAAPHDNGIGVFSRTSVGAVPAFLQLAVDGSFAPAAGTQGLAFSGGESVSIDGGRQYTNDPHVFLAIVPPGNATQVRIANDGGFAGAQELPVDPSGRYPWTLDSSGPERLPKTVYVRFVGREGPAALTFTDDIILDETPPKIGKASAVLAGTGTQAQSRPKKRRRTVVVRARAHDQTSGVAAMQVTAKRSRPGPLRTFKRRRSLAIGGKVLYLRVRDGAGNFSHWRKLVVKRPHGKKSHRAHPPS